MGDINEVLKKVKHRTSVRSFSNDSLLMEEAKKVLDYAETASEPYGIEIEWRLLDPKTYGLSSTVLSGEEIFFAGKMKRVPHAEEAFGYAFEDIVLYADSLGLGTTIIAGTMNRDAFEKAMEVADDEVMPCVTPIGFPSKKRSIKELAMRKAIGADKRIEVTDFVFDKSFETPASKEAIGNLLDVFEFVRWAPSAVNKQPWQIVLDENDVHFYKKSGKGFVDPGTGWDIQKIDLGIAMKHFEIGAEACGVKYVFKIEDPFIQTPADVEYIASYTIMRPLDIEI